MGRKGKEISREIKLSKKKAEGKSKYRKENQI